MYFGSLSLLKHIRRTSSFLGASQVMLVVKNPSANAGDVRDTGLILRSERSPGGGHGSPLQCSCLEDPMGHSQWGLKEWDTTEMT